AAGGTTRRITPAATTETARRLDVGFRLRGARARRRRGRRVFRKRRRERRARGGLGPARGARRFHVVVVVVEAPRDLTRLGADRAGERILVALAALRNVVRRRTRRPGRVALAAPGMPAAAPTAAPAPAAARGGVLVVVLVDLALRPLGFERRQARRRAAAPGWKRLGAGPPLALWL